MQHTVLHHTSVGCTFYKFTVLALLYYFQLILTNIIYALFCIHNCKTRVKLIHYFTSYLLTNLCTLAPLPTSSEVTTYSYVISKTERDLVSTFASGCNNRQSLTL